MLSLAALAQLPLPAVAFPAAAVIVLFWTWRRLMHDAYLRMADSCAGFRIEGGDEIVLLARNGRHLSGRVSSDSVVTPYLVILNVILDGQRKVRSVLILADAMEAESFRRLRVALRWGDRSDQAVV